MSDDLRVLVLYDQQSTFTNAVFDHVDAFRGHSRLEHRFMHFETRLTPTDLDPFDAVQIHYSARLIHSRMSRSTEETIAGYTGAKILIVQDEYDETDLLRQKIRDLKLDLVYTCVPPSSVEKIYPAKEFPGIRFISTLTGFAKPPSPLPAFRPMEDRLNWIGYRGRALPYWYGDLGQEKKEIAVGMSAILREAQIPHDIEWDDSKRIYGAQWTAFLENCRATLGTESGCNLFDDDGNLRREFSRLSRTRPGIEYAAARRAILGDHIEQPIMNQISPRMFEAIELGTALVLFEGSYSGVIQSDRHFIPLKKDFSNANEVIERLRDIRGLEALVRTAYDEIIGSRKWSVERFVQLYDNEVAALIEQKGRRTTVGSPVISSATAAPQRFERPDVPFFITLLWRLVPPGIRRHIFPLASSIASIIWPRASK